MDDLIRAKMHEALDVVASEGDLRSRVLNSLPADELPRSGRVPSSPHWSAGVVAALVAIAVVAGLLYGGAALGQSGRSNHNAPASNTNPLASNTGQVGTITEYLAPADLGNFGRLTSGPDGSLWFTASGANGSSVVVKVTAGGAFVEFPLPPAFTTLTAITAGPDGNVWFTETGGSPGVVASDARLANIGRVGRIAPSGTVNQYNVSASATLLVGIVAGPDRNLWVTDRAANTVFRVTVSG